MVAPIYALLCGYLVLKSILSPYVFLVVQGKVEGSHYLSIENNENDLPRLRMSARSLSPLPVSRLLRFRQRSKYVPDSLNSSYALFPGRRGLNFFVVFVVISNSRPFTSQLSSYVCCDMFLFHQ